MLGWGSPALQGSNAPPCRKVLPFVLSFHLFKHMDNAEEKATVIVISLMAMEKAHI